MGNDFDLKDNRFVNKKKKLKKLYKGIKLQF